MDEWMGIVVALAVGVPLLVGAVLVDRRLKRRADEELASPPRRGDRTVDELVPGYITQASIDAMSRPGAGVNPAGKPDGAVALSFGHLDGDFATAGGVAELLDARVLMVEDDISSIRELLQPLGMATAGGALVVAAASFDPEVLAVLRANRRASHLPVVAVEANLAQLVLLQDQVGGKVVSSADLKSGWLPADVWGKATHWRSDLFEIRVAGPGVSKG